MSDQPTLDERRQRWRRQHRWNVVVGVVIVAVVLALLIAYRPHHAAARTPQVGPTQVGDISVCVTVALLAKDAGTSTMVAYDLKTITGWAHHSTVDGQLSDDASALATAIDDGTATGAQSVVDGMAKRCVVIGAT